MNRNNLIALAAITLTVVIAAAVVVSKDRAPTSMSHELLFPALVDNVNNAATINLTSNRHKTILERDGETWYIANSDDYPALFDKVRSLLINLSGLRTLERKTGNPELYHHLNVRDPSQPDSNSVRVQVTDADGKTLADVILGKAHMSKASNMQTGVYVRKPDAEHALLVEGRAPASAEKTEWFNPDILDIASERISEVVIRHPDGETLHAVRNSPGGGFGLRNLPADRSIQSRTALNRFGSVLQRISARDIRALESFDFAGDTIETTVRTFDGLVVKVRSRSIEDRHYANFRFSYDANAAEASDDDALDQLVQAEGEASLAEQPLSVEAEARDLDQRLSGWVYQIPSFKYDVLTAVLDDYTRVTDD
ncbi:hypothetical protein J2T55_001446 [Methylohalomonas lacus]|uniref:DUF4340 domain-containing protein n=1 Tax=Methylohalomonas lacus TaxID=398773 RepID=A0AAE3HKF6_9GAMM|nr:DUF4340 domain-containing protein [Methylohalomonas lacus]MCS3903425.1 hypothetical protein [Methylohalomonas lacus]